jgi:hypothetical protein
LTEKTVPQPIGWLALVAIDARLHQHPSEFHPGLADEGFTEALFVNAWGFPYDHDAGSAGAGSDGFHKGGS